MRNIMCFHYFYFYYEIFEAFTRAILLNRYFWIDPRWDLFRVSMLNTIKSVSMWAIKLTSGQRNVKRWSLKFQNRKQWFFSLCNYPNNHESTPNKRPIMRFSTVFSLLVYITLYCKKNKNNIKTPLLLFQFCFAVNSSWFLDCFFKKKTETLYHSFQFLREKAIELAKKMLKIAEKLKNGHINTGEKQQTS